MNIVVLDGFTLNPGDLSWEGIEQFGDVVVYDRTGNNTKEIVKNIGDAEIVFTNKTPLPKEVLKQVPQLKYIGVLATGYNVVDVNAAKDLGVTVANVPTYGTQAVAQFTMALLLELCHNVGNHAAAVMDGEWTKSKDFCFWNSPLIELDGKTLGIIGFGKIGQATAKIGEAFGLNIVAFNRSKNPDLETETCKYVSLDELLETSDIISLHCPQTDATTGIINKTNIDKMKDGVMIINTSRGGLIVEDHLKDALNSGKVSGAAVDVVSSEPIKADNPLLSAKNCIITPHIAWASKASRNRLMQTAVENLKAYLEGKPINVVNK
ncbi:D-2-hydroxyacid dehydrogenase [Algibacter amylolyticus]|uniref:D-2-hydroxyacid dehydrogenase n=1 Tax=Algibacter amylolyticus TaxID=1608400 RepID=A0A5M7B4A9_9FLAO|nr:D-2-hydroxyacid dehydrogenase [Algibacter amylolyticus]KAA5824403.1 D-2-hydroxyacid dehydrogenase [Algibacter amylolyticus]MBB5269539.1 glycerate dehydrogenase [Algibacter amylolyticus]TSJ75176.1 D-2-hydroxyacid dehydrogenase [Algibacter amylolyticus]